MRFQNWEIRFNSFIEENKNKTFKYGEYDCSLFVFGAINAMTGKDYSNDIKGFYRTRKESEEFLKEKGFNNLENACTYYLGEPRININYTQRGDVVICKNGEDVMAAIVSLSGTYAWGVGKKKLQKIKKERWIKSWGLNG